MKLLVAVSSLLLAASCPPVPQPPNPVPTPTPFPTPVPTPTPVAKCFFPQGVPQEDYKLVPNPAQFSSVVDATIRENVQVCHGETDCDWGPADPQVYLSVMVKALQTKGLCAGQHEDGHSDQISVANSCAAGVTWENYQPVNFGGDIHKARFAKGNIMDGWQVPVSCGSVGPVPTPTPTPVPGPTPTPTPTPTPVPPGQPATCPPELTKFNPLAVRDQAAFIIDATPVTCVREWCNANGFPGVVCCPMGHEGDPQRAACEALFGPYEWTYQGSLCGGATCFNNNGNILQERIPKPTAGGVITVKAANGVTSVPATVPGSN